MLASLCLLSGLLAPAQPPAPVPVEGSRPATGSPRAVLRAGGMPVPLKAGSAVGEWRLTPRLPQSQELLYRGTYSEQATGGSVEFERAYTFEGRVLVLDESPQGLEVAVLTVFKDRAAAGASMKVPADAAGRPLARAARLERLTLLDVGTTTSDALGRLFAALARGRLDSLTLNNRHGDGGGRGALS